MRDSLLGGTSIPAAKYVVSNLDYPSNQAVKIEIFLQSIDS